MNEKEEQQVSIPRRDGAPLIVSAPGRTCPGHYRFNSPKGWSAPHRKSKGKETFPYRVSIPRRDGAPLIVITLVVVTVARTFVSIPRRDGAPLIDQTNEHSQVLVVCFNSPKGWSAPHSFNLSEDKSKRKSFNSPKGWSAPHSHRQQSPLAGWARSFNSPKGWSAPHRKSIKLGDEKKSRFNSPKGWSAPHSPSMWIGFLMHTMGFNSPKGWSAPHSNATPGHAR